VIYREVFHNPRVLFSSKCPEGSTCPILFIAACLSEYTNFPFRRSCHRQDRARFKDLERQRDPRCIGACCHGTLTCKRANVQTRGPRPPLARSRTPRINQKYEMRSAEFRYIYGGGQFNDTHSRSRVIVNISIRSTPTTHAYADKPRGQRCFMRVQGAFDSAMRRASCCHLFAHYITLLPSRVSPANLHYKCR